MFSPQTRRLAKIEPSGDFPQFENFLTPEVWANLASPRNPVTTSNFAEPAYCNRAPLIKLANLGKKTSEESFRVENKRAKPKLVKNEQIKIFLGRKKVQPRNDCFNFTFFNEQMEL